MVNKCNKSLKHGFNVCPIQHSLHYERMVALMPESKEVWHKSITISMQKSIDTMVTNRPLIH